MRLDSSIYIDRAPSDVFRFYAVDHVRNHPRWSPDLDLEQATGGPIGEGTVIRRRHSRYGQPIEGTMEVVKFETDRAMDVVIHDGPVEMTGWASMEPQGEGTRLTIGFEVIGSKDPIDPAPLEHTLREIKGLIETEIPATS
jgi:Polyketide cyclase / dehydrase and lipid transport